MKHINHLLLIVFLWKGFVVCAQKNNEGLYLTAQDFENGKISYQSQPQKKYKLRIHENNSNKPIQIHTGDSVYVFCKDSVFGYRDNNQQAYRIFKGLIYKIEFNASNFILYRREGLGGFKGTQLIVHYFFSVGASNNLFRLSKNNLKVAHNNQSEFADRIDLHFNSDNDLISSLSENKLSTIHLLIDLFNTKIK